MYMLDTKTVSVMKVGLRHIRYFVEIAERLSFRKAAEHLGVAQPALTRAIQFLEEELGVSLFDRSLRKIKLTHAGGTFLKDCQKVLGATDYAVKRARMAHEGRLGLLRIGYTDVAMTNKLPSLLKGFRDMHPDVVLQPENYVTTIQLEELEIGNLDIGFVTGPIMQGGFNQMLIASEPLVCVVYDTHPFSGREALRLEDLAEEDFVHGEAKLWRSFRSQFIPACQEAGFYPRIVQSAVNTAGILNLVSAGMGVTIVNESARNSLCPGVVAIPIENSAARIQTVAIWQEDVPQQPLKSFLSHIQRSLSAIDG
jgi:DNA-binding transcriptional LysR family regulator